MSSTIFRKILKYEISWKSVLVGVELFHADRGLMDGQTDMTKVIVAFRNCVYALKTGTYSILNNFNTWFWLLHLNKLQSTFYVAADRNFDSFTFCAELLRSFFGQYRFCIYELKNCARNNIWIIRNLVAGVGLLLLLSRQTLHRWYNFFPRTSNFAERK